MAETIQSESAGTLESTTVGIFRTATVVKGGRRFSFASLVVVGDRNGHVGIGYGKGRGVPAAIEKAQKDAKKQLFKVNLRSGTIPHQVTGSFCSSKVRLIPAAPGTGVIAGGTVRAVLEMAGVHDCLTKAYGSTNKKNLVKATVEGLRALRTRESIADLRGVQIESSTVDELLESSRQAMEEHAGGGSNGSQTVAEAGDQTLSEKKQESVPPPVPVAANTETQASTDVSDKPTVKADQPEPGNVPNPDPSELDNQTDTNDQED